MKVGYRIRVNFEGADYLQVKGSEGTTVIREDTEVGVILDGEDRRIHWFDWWDLEYIEQSPYDFDDPVLADWYILSSFQWWCEYR